MEINWACESDSDDAGKIIGLSYGGLEVTVWKLGHCCSASMSRNTAVELHALLGKHLEETKPNPQPGEVWEIERLADLGPYVFLGKGCLPPWRSVSPRNPDGWCDSNANPIRRVGRIVYDTE